MKSSHAKRVRLQGLSLADRIKENVHSIVDPLNTRERLVYGLLFIVFLFVFVGPGVGASVTDEGLLVRVPVQTCSANSSWSQTNNILGRPDVDASGLTSSINPSNAAAWDGSNGSLQCSVFSSIDQDHYLKQASLDLSLTGYQVAEQMMQPADEPGLVLDNFSSAPQTVEQRQTPIEPNVFRAPNETEIDGLLQIYLSVDKGKTWQPYHKLGSEVLSKTDPHIAIALAPQFVENIRDLAVKIEPIKNQASQGVLLDSLFITYKVGTSKEVSATLFDADGQKITTERPVLSTDQYLHFEVASKEKDDGLWQGLESRIENLVGKVEPADIDAETTVRNAEGVVVKTSHATLTYLERDLSNTDRWQATADFMPAHADPGVYSLSTTISDGSGNERTTEQDFLWGVLALNTNKSIYRPNEQAHLMMTVLDESGATVCDVKLRLSVDGPAGRQDFTNTDGITTNEDCTVYGPQETPDYEATAQLAEAGDYNITLTAETANGNYTIRDRIQVDDKPDFDVERSGPTRIYPVLAYPVTISVTARHDFVGKVYETVPQDYSIGLSDLGQVYTNVASHEGQQRIAWDVSLLAGQTTTLAYTFDAPDISPEFYLLGPAQLTDEQDQNVFAEARKWQVASDAIGRMIVFWDGASIPGGWTCVSCSSGDPFYQRFVKGAETYGTTGGAATHTHTASGSVSTSASTSTENRGGAEIADGSHSHTFSPTLSSPSNLPSYRQLKIIRYNTSGEPASLPTGSIAVFDAAVPSGWTRYSAQDGAYIRGEGTAGTTGGSNTHTVSISGTISSATGSTVSSRNGGSQTTGATATHTHTISPTNSASASNEPVYRQVILGKLNSSTSPPNNMISMWDDSPPTGWNSVSGSGGDLNQHYIKPPPTYRKTGGANTHSHSDTTGLTTSGPSATTNGRTGSTGSSAGHTHSASVTGYSTVNHEPPYIEVIFAKRNQQPTYQQSAYRWYENSNATDVGAVLASQDTAATAPAQGVPFRLRAALHVSVQGASSSEDSFKLQYSQRSGTCDATFTGESYVDVAAGSGNIRYADNSNPSDGTALTTNANDPTHSSDTMHAQTYEEANNFTNSQSALAIGEDGYWDFSLVDFAAPGETTYCFRVVKSDGSTLNGGYSQFPEITTAVPPPRMLLLYDGGSIPSGWSCVSCSGGDPYYQRFLRGEASTGSTGGSDTHSHTASASVSNATNNAGRSGGGGSDITASNHGHTLTPTIAAASNLPVYRQLKIIQYDAGTPSTIPSGAIALYDAVVPSGWTQYSAQNGSFVRAEGTVGSTGGSNTHVHTVTGTLGAATGTSYARDGSGSQNGTASTGHTHSLNDSINSAANQPPFIQVILAQADADTAIPGSMIAMWTSDPGGSWTCISCSGGDALYQRFFKPASSYGTTGGAASHNHSDSSVTSGVPSNSTTSKSGIDASSDVHTHNITINGISTDSNLPPYVDVIFSKSSSTNNAPNDPTNLAQTQTDTTNLTVGSWTNESSLRFEGQIDDTDSSDSLSLCVEVKPLSSSFTNNEDICSIPVTYSGTPLTVNLVIASLSDAESYHWQARTKDAFGAYSSWVSFGANAESARDVGVDTSTPTGTVYDGATTDVDIDINDGDLDSLDANWDIDSSASGLSGYEYSIGTSAGATDVLGWTNNGTTDSVTANSLNLSTSEPYYINVRTTDNAGNISIISSDGVYVAPTLSFSTSTSEIQFGDLNAGTSYTSTIASTITTSTNAYNGYLVRAFTPNLLTNQHANTISMFNGGTYALPDEWLGGDTGYGYTSSDTNVQGSNKFQGSPCPGGGDPPCYAPFSTSLPGDIIADHTAAVAGTPIVNESFIITHRVTVDPAQQPGVYQTIVIYSVTARF